MVIFRSRGAQGPSFWLYTPFREFLTLVSAHLPGPPVESRGSSFRRDLEEDLCTRRRYHLSDVLPIFSADHTIRLTAGSCQHVSSRTVRPCGLVAASSPVLHCRRTAQELWVIRTSMRTLRAGCRSVHHERMVVDALTIGDGNSVRMLQLLRDGVLSIVDEDQEPANRTTYSETRICDHIGRWSKCDLRDGIDEM